MILLPLVQQQCLSKKMNEDFIKFSTRHIDEVYIAENDKGRIDTIYRRFPHLSARACGAKIWRQHVSQDILN